MHSLELFSDEPRKLIVDAIKMHIDVDEAIVYILSSMIHDCCLLVTLKMLQ
jgi:hypothetical protein